MGKPHRIPCDLSQQAGVVTLLTNVGSAKAMDRVAPICNRLCVGDSASSARPEDWSGQVSWADLLLCS